MNRSRSWLAVTSSEEFWNEVKRAGVEGTGGYNRLRDKAHFFFYRGFGGRNDGHGLCWTCATRPLEVWC